MYSVQRRGHLLDKVYEDHGVGRAVILKVELSIHTLYVGLYLQNEYSCSLCLSLW